ncbi:hypothetical protein Pure05_33740 [Paenarthrobacter ureafaciens]|nr:hypothetical protein Pure01_32800 [Paenarthrobacter ureafaciens]GLU65133.1 hypothetical protein Pure02_33830 [Paenarthrobacter ureafaciens]GLU69434.1 hypothetical protein Pure03_34100 [Paenarthrobacter ureafaciens]GLU73789.1 hypothetical protein Pure04_35040 [Paenarthrobacter ureafaciens]GLU77934.1 hypothetical protein Pure05_33740 [Paenarthrobacter ureafaciens]
MRVDDHNVGAGHREGGTAVARSKHDLGGKAVLDEAIANLGGAGEIVGLHKDGNHVAPLVRVGRYPLFSGKLSSILAWLRESR